jgi:hypothetical protein
MKDISLLIDYHISSKEYSAVLDIKRSIENAIEYGPWSSAWIGVRAPVRNTVSEFMNVIDPSLRPRATKTSYF